MNQSDSYDLTPREISLVEKLLQEAQVAREKADAAQEKARAALSMLVQSRDLDEGSDWNYNGGKLRRVDRGQQAAAPAAAEPLVEERPPVPVPLPQAPRLVLDALAARDCNDAERAIELAARAIAEGDRGSSSHIIQASCLGDLRRHGEALQVIEAGLKVCPPEEVPNLVNERAFQEILSGDPDLWQDGWRDWESRPQRRDLARNLAAAWPEIKEWSGERDRVVLVCCDKGLGDTVLFARYLRVLTDRGCTLQLNCSRASTPFADAARGRPGVLGAYGSDAQIPKMAEHWIALESLVQHSEERIPAPYDLGPRWEPRPLDGRRPRVGLCWHGAVGYAAAKRRRPEDRALWDSLAAVEGIDFVSLQLGELGPCSEELPAGSSVMDAARIACGCDLVISVDTSSAHIAATCGVPTLVPLMRLNYWPWLSVSGDGARTPWYSSMRMFRQSKGEEWSWTFGRIKAELRKLFKLDPPTTASRKKVARRAK